MLFNYLFNHPSTFWVFPLELLAAELVFFIVRPRREKFALRFSIALAVYCLAILLIPSDLFLWGFWENLPSYASSIYSIGYCLLMFALSVCVFFVSFRGDIWNALFFCTTGYATQHLAYSVFVIVDLAFFHISLYSDDVLALRFTVQYIVMALVYVATFFIFRKNIKNDSFFNFNRWETIFISLLGLSITVVLSLLSMWSMDDWTSQMLFFCYRALAAFLIVAYQSHVCTKQEYLQRMTTMENLWRSSKHHYEMSAEQISYINMKCHDLKKQLQSIIAVSEELKQDPRVKALSKAVMIYDSFVKTGNDVLDVVLTEKSLYCEGRDIHFSCIVDGGQFSFMDDGDIYSLFGNALDNAIEAAETLPAEKRIVNLIARRADGKVCVRVENYYESELSFKDELPQTTKAKKEEHGYGMPSIRRTVEKYGGIMEVGAGDGLFSLNIVFVR